MSLVSGSVKFTVDCGTLWVGSVTVMGTMGRLVEGGGGVEGVLGCVDPGEELVLVEGVEPGDELVLIEGVEEVDDP